MVHTKAARLLGPRKNDKNLTRYDVKWSEKLSSVCATELLYTVCSKTTMANGHAVLTAKIYCTFVCFVDLFQSILMYGGQRLN